MSYPTIRVVKNFKSNLEIYEKFQHIFYSLNYCLCLKSIAENQENSIDGQIIAILAIALIGGERKVSKFNFTLYSNKLTKKTVVLPKYSFRAKFEFKFQ